MNNLSSYCKGGKGNPLNNNTFSTFMELRTIFLIGLDARRKNYKIGWDQYLFLNRHK